MPVNANTPRLSLLSWAYRETLLLRRIASAGLSIAFVVCAAMPAHATEFLRAIDDVPLVAGLSEKPEPVVFESDQGRVVQTVAEGQVGSTAISTFYVATLPSLGWKQADGQSGLVFARENERLTITVREPRSSDPVRVQFELVVKLASSRLPE